MKQFTATERVGSFRSPMSLDVGRLSAGDAFRLLGLAIASLAVASVGALLAWLAWPGELLLISMFRFIFLCLGLLVAGLGVGLAGLVIYLTQVDWFAYQHRLADYHKLVVDSHKATGGVDIERTVTGWELSSTMPAHMLVLALSVHQAVMEGNLDFSSRGLIGDRWLLGLRLGDVNQSQARQMSQMFPALGLVAGRKGGNAGEWVPQSTDEVIQLVTKNWTKAR